MWFFFVGFRDVKVNYPIISVSTASPTNISFTVRVDYESHFFIQPSKEYNLTISPSEPRYVFYNFSIDNSSLHKDDSSNNYHTVILEVFSEDDVCMTVSIQNVSVSVIISIQFNYLIKI